MFRSRAVIVESIENTRIQIAEAAAKGYPDEIIDLGVSLAEDMGALAAWDTFYHAEDNGLDVEDALITRRGEGPEEPHGQQVRDAWDEGFQTITDNLQ